MSNDLDLLGEFHAMLEDALLPAPALSTVEMDTARGREILFYSSGDDGQVCDGGTLLISADTPENRRRAAVTRACPVCPDVNQGVVSQEFGLGPEAGTCVIADYQACGHSAFDRVGGWVTL